MVGGGDAAGGWVVSVPMPTERRVASVAQPTHAVSPLFSRGANPVL